MSVEKKRPNVIVFFTDEQRWDSCGVHGNPLNLTPNLDRVARQGTLLYNNFTCQPVCTPARACLQTGLHGSASGVFRNELVLPKDVPTLADIYREHGYYTGYIGKWHLGGNCTEHPVSPTPADWQRHLESGDLEKPVPRALRGGYEYWLGVNLLEFNTTSYNTVLYDTDNNPVFLPGYRVDAITDAAVRFVQDNRERPFLLMLSHLEPHPENFTGEYAAPAGYRERYEGRWTPPDLAALEGKVPGSRVQRDIGGYWGMVRRLDEAYGRLLDAVHSMGLDDNTIVVFTTDHGEHFSTRNSGEKRSCHEASIRTPCVLTGPGFSGGGTVRELTSILDLPPTLLDASGIPVPKSMQGRSVLPLLHGVPKDWPSEVLIQIWGQRHVERALRTGRWKYCVSAPDSDAWNDAGAARYVETSLYDLRSDPHELENLAGKSAYREAADVLKQRLTDKMKNEAGEAAPAIEDAAETGSGQRTLPAEAGWQ